MKKFLIKSLFISASLLILSVLAQAQGRYQVRLVHGSYNCAKDSVVVCVEIRATSVDSAFVMGNANIQLNYPTAQLSNPSFRSRGIFSGGTYSLLGLVKTPGVTTSALGINIVNNGVNGEGQAVGTDWKPIACIAFSTVGNTSKCYNLNISATNPSTVVQMAQPDPVDPQNNISKMTTVTQGSLTSITNQCPVNPTAALSGGGTINTGGSSNLVVTSQNSVFPATVVLSGNAGTVTLTQLEQSKSIAVSPTQTTNYTIQSITGDCGAGTGQGTAKVTVQTGGSGGASQCVNVKCIPLTLRIIN